MKKLPIIALIGLLSAGVFTYAQSDAPQVIVQSVKLQPMSRQVEALGTLRANESIRLTSHTTKTVTRINFNDGQRVEAGQVLVEMTSAEELALLEEARTNTDESRKQLDRVRSLAAQGAASQSLLDERVREHESAKARYAAIEARLEDLRLKAPFSGFVGLRNISVGALVSPGDLITNLNDDSRMKLDFTVPAVYLNDLDTGLVISARSRVFPGEVFEGEVFSIDNQVDPVTRAITVRALLPNEERLLKQGILMNVTLKTRERETLVVSESALVTVGSVHSVFVVEEAEGNFEARERRVSIGQRQVGIVEITEGLSAGERVVTHGLQRVRSGQPVTILAEESGGDPVRPMLNGAGEQEN
ncbi:MAG TPA: efflux RND transporter periplasmic adaptor subunit [Cellvibrionaceae bacterium]